jgi:RND family efflux transporter MFP subunit
MAPVTEQELNDALTALRVAEADLRLALDDSAALVATAQEREALLQIARQRLANTLTKAPPIPSTLGQEGAQEWVVSARLVTEGQYLEVAAPLFRLLIRDPLKLRCKVPERYASLVRRGQTVNLKVIEGASQPSGRIARISPAVDPASRTFEIEALVGNAAGGLIPGAFGAGEIIADDQVPRLLVPAAAVITTGGAPRVFVVDNGRAREREVQIGRQADGLVEIVAGLDTEAAVISRGAGALTDGTEVEAERAGD